MNKNKESLKLTISPKGVPLVEVAEELYPTLKCSKQRTLCNGELELTYDIPKCSNISKLVPEKINKETKTVGARRYNADKTRLSLIPKEIIEELGKVYTKGAAKYSDFNSEGMMTYDGANNWKKGLPYMDVVDSTLRHLYSWIDGEDQDPEMGTEHLAHAIWNLGTLLYYSKHNKYLDNRPSKTKHMPRIGLDIDGVLAEFSDAFLVNFGLSRDEPNHWNDPRFRNETRWKEIENNENFWMGIDIIKCPETLIFEPTVYCTARSIPTSWTQKWLNNKGYPVAPVISVGRSTSKVDALRGKVDIFVDDHYDNFVELNNAGIYTLLMSRKHNEKYDVGDMRIHDLDELKNYI